MSYHNRNFDDYEPRQSKDYHKYQYPQVEFSAVEERYYTREPVKTRRSRKGQIALLLFPFIFLAAACSLGATSTVLRPWWTQKAAATPEYEWIQLGLWQGCIKKTKDGDWECKDYDNDKESESPFDKMDVLQICMITATSIAGVATISTVVIAIARDKKLFKPLVYIVCLLSLASAVLFGVCIAYASEEDEAVKLVPTWMTVVNRSSKFDHGMMFYFAIGAASSAFLALIFYSVFLFVSDDDDDNSDTLSNSSGNVKTSKNKQANERAEREGNDYERYDIEREISQRGHNLLNNHRHHSVYPHKAQELDTYRHPYQQQYARGMEHPQDRSRKQNSSRNERRKHGYQSEPPYDYTIDQGYRPYRELHRDLYGNRQPAVIGGQQVRVPSYNRHQYPPNYERYPAVSELNSSIPDHQRQPSRYFELQPAQPKFFQQRPSSVPLDDRIPSKKQYRKSENLNYGEYEMYFNSPY